MIQVKDLCFSYGKRSIVRDLTFDAAPGECVVLAGPNGCGKSTVLSVIAGVQKPRSGCVHLEGSLGYVPQGNALFSDASGEENLRFFADLAGVSVPEILPFAVETYKKKKVARLSGGMQKQLSIACAMLGDPSNILLDEPCASLDIGFGAELGEYVKTWKAEGRSVIYVGHDPAEFYGFFDKIVFLSGTPRVYTREELLNTDADEARFRIQFETLFYDKQKESVKYDG